jgi:hypothetical protein
MVPMSKGDLITLVLNTATSPLVKAGPWRLSLRSRQNRLPRRQESRPNRRFTGGRLSLGPVFRWSRATPSYIPLSGCKLLTVKGREDQNDIKMIDKAYVAVVFLQTVLTTLRAGSRALYMWRTGSIGVMEGPPILPPRQLNESAALWELSTAFRHTVLLANRPDLYDTFYTETSLAKGRTHEEEEYADATRTSDVYRLSSFGISSQDGTDEEIGDEELDRKIGELLEEAGIMNLTSTNEEDAVAHCEKQEGTDEASEKAPPKAFVSRIVGMIARGVSQTRRSVRKDFLRRWRLVEEDFDEILEDEPLGANVASATSFHTRLEISSGMAPSKNVSLYAYTPEIFRDLRRSFGVTESDYVQSILESGPYISFQSNSKGAARVGGVFFFTRDGAYLIKTIKRDEVGAFLQLLPKYHQFMRRNGRRSLLTRFCGMYEIEVPTKDHIRRETFVVMNSVFPAESSKFISERFDLKGSTMGRECSPEEKVLKGSNAVLKDMDLAKEVELIRSLKQDGGEKDIAVGLHIGPTAKASLMGQLRRDVQLLADCNLIDYSLLVGTAIQMSKGPSIRDMVVMGISDKIEQQEWRKDESKKLLNQLLTPFRIFLSPPVLLLRNAALAVQRAISSPLPYYGSEFCAVEAGRLSHLHGERYGQKALYYFGLIDFLQPFNWKKTLEWKWKVLRYGEGFSCVPPDEYAQRFLAFVDKHVT